MTPKFGENWLMKCIVVFSFWGASPPPDPLTRGSAPGPRWGHSPQTPIIGSRYRARHSPPNAKTKLRLCILEFIRAKDDGSGGVNLSYTTCKAPVKSSPPTFHRPNALPVSVRELKGESITFHGLAHLKLTWESSILDK